MKSFFQECNGNILCDKVMFIIVPGLYYTNTLVYFDKNITYFISNLGFILMLLYVAFTRKSCTRKFKYSKTKFLQT